MRGSMIAWSPWLRRVLLAVVTTSLVAVGCFACARRLDPDGGEPPLGSPLPGVLVLRGDRLGVPFATNEDALVPPPSIPLLDSLASALNGGTLVNDRGQTTSFRVTGQALVVDTAPASGSFKGVLTSGIGGSEARVAEIELLIRDGVVMPLVTLVGGLLVALCLDVWVTRLRPRLIAQEDLERLRSRSISLSDDAGRDLAELKAWLGANREPFRLSGRTAGLSDGPGLLDIAIDSALEEIDRPPSLNERQLRWGHDGSEMSRVREYVEVAQLDLNTRSLTVNQAMRHSVRASEIGSWLESSGAHLARAGRSP